MGVLSGPFAGLRSLSRRECHQYGEDQIAGMGQPVRYESHRGSSSQLRSESFDIKTTDGYDMFNPAMRLANNED